MSSPVFPKRSSRLIGVYHGQDRSPDCLGRRRLPINVEENLTMFMTLDETCMACGNPDPRERKEKKAEINAFLKRYELLDKDELAATLAVTVDDLCATLQQEVPCVGCRKSVEILFSNIVSTGVESDLSPLVVSEAGIISISRDHIFTPSTLANLFCIQLPRLLKVCLLDRTTRKGVRCSAHTLGNKKSVSRVDWQEIWMNMEVECRDEIVLIPFDMLRETTDRYLKKHGFCGECTSMVNSAYTLLIDSDQHDGPYKGITACHTDRHVHIPSDTEFISRLLFMAEPELSDLRQERHAKTIEIAQKEILICIGVALHERFQRIHIGMREGQASCDLLCVTALITLKKYLDLAVQKRQGGADIDSLCREIEEETRQKQEKAQKKREKKKKKKNKENEDVAAAVKPQQHMPEGKHVLKAISNTGPGPDGDCPPMEQPVTTKVKFTVDRPQACRKRVTDLWTEKEAERFNGELSLGACIMDDDELSDEEVVLTQEEIEHFQARHPHVDKEVRELRQNLKEKFENLRVKR